MSLVYHATTPRKLERYRATGCILPPVRFWRSAETGERWARKTKRTILVVFELPATAYPLPDHQPPRMAWWSPDPVREYEVRALEPAAAAKETPRDE